MARLPAWTARRVELAGLYDTRLAGLPLALPARSADRTHVYHRYCIRTPWRDELQVHLAAAGVETAIHYPVPVHRQPAARSGGVTVAGEGLAVTERQSSQILSLPLHPSMAEEQIAHVTDRITDFHQQRAHRVKSEDVAT